MDEARRWVATAAELGGRGGGGGGGGAAGAGDGDAGHRDREPGGARSRRRGEAALDPRHEDRCAGRRSCRCRNCPAVVSSGDREGKGPQDQLFGTTGGTGRGKWVQRICRRQGFRR